MQRKFLTLVENSIARFSNGGFLVGDVVKFAPSFKSKESFKELTDDVKKYITDFMKTDKPLRVVDIVTSKLTPGPGNSDNRGAKFSVVLATELAPGSFDLQNKVTVPGDLLIADNPYPNLPPIANSLRKKEKINLKPVKPEEDEEVVNAPYDQTLQSQIGDTVKRGDRSLGNVNVKIPSKSVKTPMTAGSYTKMYVGG
jgi:hypothetical protein